jgi:hypothetical protein
VIDEHKTVPRGRVIGSDIPWTREATTMEIPDEDEAKAIVVETRHETREDHGFAVGTLELMDKTRMKRICCVVGISNAPRTSRRFSDQGSAH